MNDLVYRNDDAVAVNEKDCCVVYKQYNLSHQGILVPGLSLVQHFSDVDVRLYRDILDKTYHIGQRMTPTRMLKFEPV